MIPSNSAFNQGHFIKADGTPDIAKLISTANRCTPTLPGGLAWLDNIRFCRWGPNQWTDGRKHDIEGNVHGAAFPFDGASDCRPFTVDDIINDSVALKTTAFWRAVARPGSSGDEASGYAIALVEYLIGTVLYDKLTREVELSAQYEEHYGWTVLAPRWRREMGMRRAKVTMQMILAEAQAAQQQIQQLQQTAMTPSAPSPALDPNTLPPGPTGPTGPQAGADAGAVPAAGAAPAAPDNVIPLQTPEAPMPEIDPQLVGLAQLPQLIMDPAQEAAAVAWFQNWYDGFIQAALPEEFQDAAPSVKKSTIVKVVRELRATGKSSAPIPYVCKDELEICALKPWDEVYLPPELTNADEFVIQAERVTEAQLRSRIITDGYNAAWVELAVKQKGVVSPPTNLPVGISGQALSTLGGSQSVAPPGQTTGNSEQGLIQILHAVYREADADGVPGVYMTTFMRAVINDKNIENLYAAHGLADSPDGELPYVAGSREHWCRSVTASRSVPEVASTHQNLIKGFLDSIIDRTSITIMPPINIYESPTGTAYKFGPARKNFVRHGREPQFMTQPAAGGIPDGVAAHGLVQGIVDNYFGRSMPDVPPAKAQMKQEMSVKRFLILWSRAFQQGLCLCQQNMKDADFAEITGAPAGWLDAHREDESLLTCELHFDVRELDPAMVAAQIEAVNKTIIPTDTLGVIDRAKWAIIQLRGINPVWARELAVPQNTASQQKFEWTHVQILKMFAGNQPAYLDVKDPTAPMVLQYTTQIITSNDVYLRALDDEALVSVLGQNAPQVIQQLGGRHPDPKFSALLLNWLKNLKFTGVTQPQNKTIGRIGVNPNDAGAPGAAQPAAGS